VRARFKEELEKRGVKGQMRANAAECLDSNSKTAERRVAEGLGKDEGVCPLPILLLPWWVTVTLTLGVGR
jgi:hypothetical protein